MSLKITFSVSAIGEETVEGLLKVEERGGGNPTSYPLIVKRDEAPGGQFADFAAARGYDAAAIGRAIEESLAGLPAPVEPPPPAEPNPASGEDPASAEAGIDQGGADPSGVGESDQG